MQLKLVLACFSYVLFFVLKKFRVQISWTPNMTVDTAISNRNLRISTGLFLGAMFRWFGGATMGFLRDPNSVKRISGPPLLLALHDNLRNPHGVKNGPRGRRSGEVTNRFFFSCAKVENAMGF